jgi:hypothetical protein
VTKTSAGAGPVPNSALHRTWPRNLLGSRALYFRACRAKPVSLDPLDGSISVLGRYGCDFRQ